MTAEALSSASGTDAGALGRMLRLLAVAGVFEAQGNRWCHTELSRHLRSDHPQSVRDFVRMIGSRVNWAAAGELDHALRTGKAAVERVAPGGIWSYYRDHPDEARVFDAAMTQKSHTEIATLIPAFDFTRYRVVADVGGGRGHILAAILAAAPNTRGILFDLPEVVANVMPAPRMSLQAGSFFTDALPVADAYVLGNVIHDWADGEAAAILRSVRRVIPGHAELLVLEAVMPEGSEPDRAKVVDIVMLAVTGGRERTHAEYASLFGAAGFRLDRVVATAGPVSVIVGVPA
jgi:hypothetical protein